jgi:Mycolic acid cyclopropane synthetase
VDAQDEPDDVHGSSTKNPTTMDESRSSTATASSNSTPCAAEAASSAAPSLHSNKIASSPAAAFYAGAAGNDNDDDDHNLAPFNPSSDSAMGLVLDILNLKDDDVLFDLGCGDGRLLIRAIQQSNNNTNAVRCVGIEIDNVFATRAQEAIHQQLSREEQRRIEIRRQDLLEMYGAAAATSTSPHGTTNNNNVNAKQHEQPHGLVAVGGAADLCRDLSLLEDSTALYLYLLPRGLKKLRPLLEQIVARRKEQGKSFRVVAYTFQVVGWDPVVVNRSTKSGVPIYLYQFDP